MNVKPGDLAKIHAPGHPNHGLLVEVMQSYDTANLPLLVSLSFPGQWWEVKVLQPAKQYHVDGIFGRKVIRETTLMAGQLTPCPDSLLRRVDPEPLEEEIPAPPVKKELEDAPSA